jgi:hypothetical protein
MRIWNLDCDSGSDCDIEVFIPGPSYPLLVDVGSFLLPVDVYSGSIAAPISRRQRSFISSVEGPVTQPTIANPPYNGPWELYLYVVGDNQIILNDASNLKLSGQWVSSADSILYLQWDGNSRYVEGGRNEI